MKPLKRAWRRLSGTLTGVRSESGLADEIACHIAMQAEDNLRAGMDPAQARRAAMLKFGGVESVKESIRDQRGWRPVEALFMDLRYALRGLRKSKGFTTVGVLTLALGIGANTAVFSLVNEVLLHPPGILNPERVIAVQTSYGKLHLESTVSSPRVLTDLHDSPQIFEHAALASSSDANYAGGDGVPQSLKSASVTAEWFDVFGAKPSLGRVFAPEEDQPNANRVVVLSYAAWTRLFGADKSVVGRVMELNQVPHQILGVMPPDFRWPQEVDVWVPAGLPAPAFATRNRFNERYLAVGRTRPDVSLAAAKAWMRLLTGRVYSEGGPGATFAKNNAWSLSVVPFVDAVVGDTKTPLLILLGAVALVLLIACSNIAGLLLARASARGREFALRAALGASRGQLLRSVLTESLVLAFFGGLLGIALAYGGVPVLLKLAPEDVVQGLQPRLNIYVLLFCAAAAIASALLFGTAPGWQLSRRDAQSALKGDDRASTVGQKRQRMRSALVVAETALALMLLVAAGVFLRSFVRIQDLNPGFEPQGIITAAFRLPPESYPAGREQPFFRTVLERLNNTKGIAAAALGTTLPFSGGSFGNTFQIEGRVLGPAEPEPYGSVRFITPDYFKLLGIPLKNGRYFTEQDRGGSERVAVIDENLARQYWSGQDPVGKRIVMNGTYRIVGVVGHVAHSHGALDSGKGLCYITLFQQPRMEMSILVKTHGDAAGIPTMIREAVREADPQQAVHSFRSMQDDVVRSLGPRRFGMRLLGFFAATALFLAALGLYGVISYSVAQRRREIGIRMALGAEKQGVTKLVVGHGLRLAAVGVGIGIAGSLAGAPLIQSQLFEVRAFDPLTIGVTSGVLLAAAMLASYLPARRAMAVDPVVALRVE